MIHYHGTPIGGKTNDAIRFLCGRHALVSYQYPQHLTSVIEACQSFVLDSGAYTVWSKGGKLDIDGYIKWVESFSRHPGFDWALIPDIIDGSEADNDNLLNDWPTNIRGIPVYHIHESSERLDKLVNTYPMIALGSSGEYSSPNSKIWWERIFEVMEIICDELGRPKCKLHGLRMLNPAVFTKLPLASADSANAAVNNGRTRWCKFGSYAPPSAWQRSAIIADRIESFNSSQVWGGLGINISDLGGEDMEDFINTSDFL